MTTLSELTADDVKKAEALLQQLKKEKDPNLALTIGQKILQMGGMECKVPQLIVMGMRTPGKTTLIDSLIGAPLGCIDDPVGTLVPVEVTIGPTEATNAGINYKLNGDTVGTGQIQQAVSVAMRKMKELSNVLRGTKRLSVGIYAPKVLNAVFVDLPAIEDSSKPGAVNRADGELTKQFAESYVKHQPNEVYLYVLAASERATLESSATSSQEVARVMRQFGLTAKNSIIVQTEAQKFLVASISQKKTCEEILELLGQERDAKGEVVPANLVELFSQTQAERNEPLQQQIKLTNGRINEGTAVCARLIKTSLRGADSAKEALLKRFSADTLKQELNRKCTAILISSLKSCQGDLIKRRRETRKKQLSLQKELNKGHVGLRSDSQKFIQEVIEMAKSIIEGRCVIARRSDDPLMLDSGAASTLEETLEEGHDLALSMYTEEAEYDPETLERVLDTDGMEGRENALPALLAHLDQEEGMMELPVGKEGFQRLWNWLLARVRILEPGKRVKLGFSSDMTGDLEESLTGMMHLMRLGACASAVVLKRILRAAVNEVARPNDSGKPSASSVQRIASNFRFVGEVLGALDDCCRDRAEKCSEALCEGLQSAIQVVDLGLVESFLQSCSRFEAAYLNSTQGTPAEASTSAATALDPKSPYVQFKTLRAAYNSQFLANLAYYFTKDIREPPELLAHIPPLANDKTTDCPSNELVSLLEKALMYNPETKKDRNDEELAALYNFGGHLQIMQEELQAERRAESFIKCALDCLDEVICERRIGRIDFFGPLTAAHLALVNNQRNEPVAEGQVVSIP